MNDKRRQGGFTVIELLTVIAIIGVLAAIIFPVMSSSKKHARKAQCINNLMQIYTAVKQFQLDEGRYPDFIAGPVMWKDSATKDLTPINLGGDPVPINKSNGMVNGRLVSLYPEYIDSTAGLTCPLSDVNGEVIGGRPREYTPIDYDVDPFFAYGNSPPPPGVPASSLRITGADQTTPNQTPFYVYLYSSYDTQWPRYAPFDREAHYAPVWQFVTKAVLDTMTPEQQDTYARQLMWRNPPADTVVTRCSHHRGLNPNRLDQSSKDLVLFLDGHVRDMDSRAFADWKTAWQVEMPQ